MRRYEAHEENRSRGEGPGSTERTRQTRGSESELVSEPLRLLRAVASPDTMPDPAVRFEMALVAGRKILRSEPEPESRHQVDGTTGPGITIVRVAVRNLPTAPLTVAFPGRRREAVRRYYADRHHLAQPPGRERT